MAALDEMTAYPDGELGIAAIPDDPGALSWLHLAGGGGLWLVVLGIVLPLPLVVSD